MQLAHWNEKCMLSRTKKKFMCGERKTERESSIICTSERERNGETVVLKTFFFQCRNTAQCLVTIEFAGLWIARQISICSLHRALCENEQWLTSTEQSTCHSTAAGRKGGLSWIFLNIELEIILMCLCVGGVSVRLWIVARHFMAP